MPKGMGYGMQGPMMSGGQSPMAGGGAHHKPTPAHEVAMVRHMKRSGPTGPKSKTVASGHPLKRAGSGGGLGTKHGSRSSKPSFKGKGPKTYSDH